jgi:hypothetical protein
MNLLQASVQQQGTDNQCPCQHDSMPAAPPSARTAHTTPTPPPLPRPCSPAASWRRRRPPARWRGCRR